MSDNSANKKKTASIERRIEIIEIAIETILIMALVVAAHLTLNICYQIVVAAKSIQRIILLNYLYPSYCNI